MRCSYGMSSEENPMQKKRLLKVAELAKNIFKLTDCTYEYIFYPLVGGHLVRLHMVRSRFGYIRERKYKITNPDLISMAYKAIAHGWTSGRKEKIGAGGGD